MPTQPWTDEEEVIRRANDSRAGLGACVWGRDVARAERIGKRLQAGSVFINSFEKPTPQALFGGHKESGIGGEWGKEVRCVFSVFLLLSCATSCWSASPLTFSLSPHAGSQGFHQRARLAHLQVKVGEIAPFCTRGRSHIVQVGLSKLAAGSNLIPLVCVATVQACFCFCFRSVHRARFFFD